MKHLSVLRGRKRQEGSATLSVSTGFHAQRPCRQWKQHSLESYRLYMPFNTEIFTVSSASLLQERHIQSTGHHALVSIL